MDPKKALKFSLQTVINYLLSFLIGGIIYVINMTLFKDETVTIVATIVFCTLMIVTQFKNNNK